MAGANLFVVHSWMYAMMLRRCRRRGRRNGPIEEVSAAAIIWIALMRMLLRKNRSSPLLFATVAAVTVVSPCAPNDS